MEESVTGCPMKVDLGVLSPSQDDIMPITDGLIESVTVQSVRVLMAETELFSPWYDSS